MTGWCRLNQALADFGSLPFPHGKIWEASLNNRPQRGSLSPLPVRLPKATSKSKGIPL